MSDIRLAGYECGLLAPALYTIDDGLRASVREFTDDRAESRGKHGKDNAGEDSLLVCGFFLCPVPGVSAVLGQRVVPDPLECLAP